MTKQKPIATPSRTNEILDQYGLSAKKSLGQNFIMEPQILSDMLDVANVTAKSSVLEIGPGIGALTEALLSRARDVLAIELDQRMLPVLEGELGQEPHFHLVHGDVLKLPLKALVEEHLPRAEELLVVANLPYYITTPILFALLESDLPIDRLALLMQKEVAERLTAAPKTKAYGSLTLALAYYCHCELALKVPKTVFKPRPNVDSAVVLLTKRQEAPVRVQDEDLFKAVIRASFQQRRKTLWNNLRAYFGRGEAVLDRLEAALKAAKLNKQVRAEALTLQEFAALANALSQEDFTVY